jgi:signal-transduction protein with cAMP-binding, CBS, and nucleotidyltransferase domain
MMMERIEDAVRGGTVVVAREHETVLDVAREMSAMKIGAVVVVASRPGSERPEIRGIFSERDLMSRVVARGVDPAGVNVGAVMTSPVVTAPPGDDYLACLIKMQAARCRHLPIVEDGRLVGMLSLRDVLTAELVRRQTDMEMLELYTWGRTIDEGRMVLVWRCRACQAEATGEFPPSVCSGCGGPGREFMLAPRREPPALGAAA